MWLNLVNRYTGKRRRMRKANYELLLSTTLPNGKVVPKGGWEIESAVKEKPAFVPSELLKPAPVIAQPDAIEDDLSRESLEAMSVRALVAMVKQRGLQINTAQKKDALIDDIIAAI